MMPMLFGSKVIKLDVLDDKEHIILSVEKNFVVPTNISSDEDSIIMIKGRDLPEFDRNTLVFVVATTKSGDRIKYNGAVSVSMDTQMNIRIMRNNDTQVLEERRRYFKLKISEKGRMLFYVRDEKTIRFDEPREINILDINVGGVFLVVEEELIPDDLVCIEVDLFSDYPLNAAARVLRVQRDSDGSILGYGCEFEGLTAAQEDYIGRYIYKVQSEIRQRKAAQEEASVNGTGNF